MYRWVFRQTCANADDKEKRLVKHRALIKELKDGIIIGLRPKNIDSRQIKAALIKIKLELCAPQAKTKLITRKEIKKDDLMDYVPVPRTWLKDLFVPEEVNELASVLRGRQREVFVLCFGPDGLTERDVAVRLGTTQQNISKIRERAVKNVLDKKIFAALEDQRLYF